MILRSVSLALGICMAGPVLADASLECSLSAGSQVEIGDCVAETEARVNAALDLALEQARAAAEELDGVTGRAVSVPALDTAQAAWSAWRDAECEFVGSTWGGGSGTGIAITACRIGLARDRTEALLASIP